MSKQTSIAQIGEIGLIEKIKTLVPARVDDANLSDSLLRGIGDDTAVYRPTPGKVQLLTTDAFIEGVHFDLTFTAFQHLGWKAMTANLSDIAAMGGTPRYATVVISLPQKISVEMIEDFYHGVAAACKKFSCLVVGGDTTASTGNVAVAVTMTGEAEETKLIYRSGAKPGDLLVVSGHLGASHAGLKVLQREKERFMDAGEPDTFTPNLEQYTAAIQKHLVPNPRLDLSRIIVDDFPVHAMIDISDGLASEVHRICAASGTGASVYEHNLPVESITQAVAGEFGDKPTDYALYGGEEYELLFAIDDATFEKLEAVTGDITIIGRVRPKEDGIMLVKEQGETVPLLMAGWDHFTAQT